MRAGGVDDISSGQPHFCVPRPRARSSPSASVRAHPTTQPSPSSVVRHHDRSAIGSCRSARDHLSAGCQIAGQRVGEQIRLRGRRTPHRAEAGQPVSDKQLVPTTCEPPASFGAIASAARVCSASRPEVVDRRHALYEPRRGPCPQRASETSRPTMSRASCKYASTTERGCSVSTPRRRLMCSAPLVTAVPGRSRAYGQPPAEPLIDVPKRGLPFERRHHVGERVPRVAGGGGRFGRPWMPGSLERAEQVVDALGRRHAGGVAERQPIRAGGTTKWARERATRFGRDASPASRQPRRGDDRRWRRRCLRLASQRRLRSRAPTQRLRDGTGDVLLRCGCRLAPTPARRPSALGWRATARRPKAFGMSAVERGAGAAIDPGHDFAGQAIGDHGGETSTLSDSMRRSPVPEGATIGRTCSATATGAPRHSTRHATDPLTDPDTRGPIGHLAGADSPIAPTSHSSRQRTRAIGVGPRSKFSRSLRSR